MKLTLFRHAAYDSPWWAFPQPALGSLSTGRARHSSICLSYPLGPRLRCCAITWARMGTRRGRPKPVDRGGRHRGVPPNRLRRLPHIRAYGRRTRRRRLRPQPQALADTVRARGTTAMITPSAALPGTHNMILFGVRVAHPFLWEPLMPEEIPTGHLTDGARAAAEVAEHVRWFGTPHRAVEQWKATGSYDLFDDPIATRW